MLVHHNTERTTMSDLFTSQSYPPFLESYGALLSHLENQFAGLSPQDKSDEKGDRFVEFALRLIPHLDISARFERPQPNKKKTHDKGVDITAEGREKTEILFVQSKYSIADVPAFDSILSKFQSFDAERRGLKPAQARNLSLFADTENDGHPVSHFMIVTSTDLRSIKTKYERSQMASRDFYDKLVQQDRLHIVDGPTIFPIVRSAFRKQSVLPTNMTLKFVKPFMNVDDVYIGVVSGTQLAAIYDEFGNSLFLENIREFLGQSSGRINPSASQVSVNKEITRTLTDEPEKFLARNNGITFRAGRVDVTDDTTLVLNDASIVNGCQTTMSVVQNGAQGSRILVKIVQSSDSWDIAEAANFQNEIKQLDLRLARYIRPQEVRNYTSRANIGFKSASDEASAYALLDSFYQNEITYEEVRSLFIGLFSNTPNNAIDTNYTKIRSDIVGPLFENSESKERVFDILFKIHAITQEAARQIQEMFKDTEDADLFRRFWSEDKPNYRAFLAILAACGCLKKNIYADTSKFTYQSMVEFLDGIQRIVDRRPEIFIRYYRNAFLVVSFDVGKPGVDPDKIVHMMYRAIDGSDFRNLHSGLARLARMDDKLVELEKEA
jgi:hypothetical protein